jgi:hypothetical protein
LIVHQADRWTVIFLLDEPTVASGKLHCRGRG